MPTLRRRQQPSRNTVGPERQRSLLIISNGHGEDTIGAALAARMPEGWRVAAYPALGGGHAYDGVCEIVGPRSQLASEGWRNVRGSLARDAAGGGLSNLLPGLRFGREAAKAYDRITIVGDFAMVAGAFVVGMQDVVWVDVYRTGFGRLYSRLERATARRVCAKVFCRHEALAGQLRGAGADATAPGNLMMDTIPVGDYDARAVRTHEHAVLLLPGSRQYTAEAFAVQAAALKRLAQPVDAFVAVAGGVEPEALAAAVDGKFETNIVGDALGTIVVDGLAVRAVRGRALRNVIEAADVVLSQAGTATVQAMGLGKPLVTFTTGRDRRSRIADEQRLFGEARIMTTANPDAVAAELQRLLADPAERDRLGAVGRQRIGPPGAIDQVLAVLSA